MNKEEAIKQFSNPSIVYERAKQLFGKSVQIKLSTRLDKKYMIYINGKWVHFGQMGAMDYTYHLNKQRLYRFQQRNRKWLEQPYDTPGFLSFVLLW